MARSHTADPTRIGTQSVMKGHGYYSEHSAVQHGAASVAYPLLEAAAGEVPIPRAGPLTIGDFGCAGGRNEMEPLRRALAVLRRRSATTPIDVVHSDLPTNDFTSLFALVYGGEDSYLAGTTDVRAFATGRTLYESVLAPESLTLGWTAITVHWLSSVEGLAPDRVFANLNTGAARERIEARARHDWQAFLRERARELVPGGQVVVVGGASAPDGTSGAEGLFELIDDELHALVTAGTLTAGELAAMYFPTFNRTEAEFRAPFDDGQADDLELLDVRFDTADDGDTYPQYRRHGDAPAFASAYVPFVRAFTEPCLFRSLSPDRSPDERAAVIEAFYEGLRARIAAEPERATCHWHVVSLRIRRRPAG